LNGDEEAHFDYSVVDNDPSLDVTVDQARDDAESWFDADDIADS
jgi:hypothetical protein